MHGKVIVLSLSLFCTDFASASFFTHLFSRSPEISSIPQPVKQENDLLCAEPETPEDLFNKIIEDNKIEKNEGNKIIKITFQSSTQRNNQAHSPLSNRLRTLKNKYENFFDQKIIDAIQQSHSEQSTTFLQDMISKHDLSPNLLFIDQNDSPLSLFQLGVEIGQDSDIQFLMNRDDFDKAQKDRKNNNIMHILIQNKKFSKIVPLVSQELKNILYDLLLTPNNEQDTPLENACRNAQLSDVTNLLNIWPDLATQSLTTPNVELNGKVVESYTRSLLFMIIQGWSGNISDDEMKALEEIVQQVLNLGVNPWTYDSENLLPIDYVEASPQYDSIRTLLCDAMNEAKLKALGITLAIGTSSVIATSILHYFLRLQLGRAIASAISCVPIMAEFGYMVNGIYDYYQKKIPVSYHSGNSSDTGFTVEA